MKNVLIFIVERNPVWGNLLKYRLTTGRFMNTRLLHNPEEALSLISGNTVPNFVIVDSEDQSINCLEFLRRIRLQNSFIRVIFFTRSGDCDLATEVLNAGATDYIVISGKQDAGIPELIKNLTYLCQEDYQYR